MSITRFLKRMAVNAGLTILIAWPVISRPQSTHIASTSPRAQGASIDTAPTKQSGSQLVTAPAPRMTQETAGQSASQRKPAQIDEYIMSLPLSGDQKAQISQINQSMKSRMDMVAEDDKETSDQKQAMTEGLQRMRLRQILMVLTHEQRLQLRTKLASKSSAAPGQGTMLHQAPLK